jgi:hypothetical protein
MYSQQVYSQQAAVSMLDDATRLAFTLQELPAGVCL